MHRYMAKCIVQNRQIKYSFETPWKLCLVKLKEENKICETEKLRIYLQLKGCLN